MTESKNSDAKTTDAKPSLQAADSTPPVQLDYDILVLLGDGFEEIEAITPIDILRRADLRVLTVAVGENLTVRGSHGIAVMAEALLTDVLGPHGRPQSSQPNPPLLLLPGGPGIAALRQNPLVLEMVRRQFAAQARLAAICAAPLVLAEAGVLRDRQVTSFPGVAVELRPKVGGYSEERVVIDGHICTSRGAGTAEEFSLALVAWLRGPEAAERVRRSIVART